MFCKEKLTSYLASTGYNVVRLPRENIKPLDLIGKDGKTFDNLGSLTTVWSSEQPLPQLDKDQSSAKIVHKETSMLDLSVGLNALSDIFSGMGFSIPKLDLAFKNSKKLKFSFDKVLIDNIPVLKIGRYLKSAELSTLDTDNVFLKYFFDEDKKIYVITEVLKSKSISIEAYDANKTAAKIDAKVLEGALKAHVGVEAKSETESKITYTGKKDLVFGFKCYEIAYIDGMWKVQGIGGEDVFLDDSETEDKSGAILSEASRIDVNE